MERGRRGTNVQALYKYKHKHKHQKSLVHVGVTVSSLLNELDSFPTIMDEEDKDEYFGHAVDELEHNFSPPTIENPFRHQAQPNSNVKRQHFPSFDKAMAAGSHSSASSNASQHAHQHTPAATAITSAARDVLDRSIDSSAVASSIASSLNMSIGAKAALNEHLRHISKFGLDESHCNSNSSTNSPLRGSTTSISRSINPRVHQERIQQDRNVRHQTKPPKTTTVFRNPLDALWSKILDTAEGNDGSNLFIAPTSSNSSFRSPPGLDRVDTIVSVGSGDAEGTDAIEVSSGAAGMRNPFAQQQQHPQLFTWDPYAHDDNRSRSSKSTTSFFNTSRVEELYTPERNQTKLSPDGIAGGLQRTVTLRNTNYSPTSPSILEDSSSLADQSSMIMANMFRALTIGPSTPPPVLDASFGSFGVGAADLSRISGNGGQSPDTSFPPHHHHQSPLNQQHSLSSLHQHNQLLFPSWDDDSYHGPMLDVSPPPPPPRRTTASHLVGRAANRQARTSLPIPRTHRSYSPPETLKRKPLLHKQYSCPDWNPLPEEKSTSKIPENNVFSEAARRAGLLALAHEQPLRRQEEQNWKPSPPTQNLMDFFRDRISPDTSSSSKQDRGRSHPEVFPQGEEITMVFPNETSVDDISTIRNDSSSGGQQNTSSSSSSRMKQFATVARRPSGGREVSSATILNKSTLSSSSSSAYSGNPLERRRYRTVVPSRVFLTEEPEGGYFPVQRDSFSVKEPSASASSPPKQQEEEASLALLQNSFEAAYQVSVFEQLTEDAQSKHSRSGNRDRHTQH
jgi:hypothetical protein